MKKKKITTTFQRFYRIFAKTLERTQNRGRQEEFKRIDENNECERNM